MFQAIKSNPSETYQNTKPADLPWAGKEAGRRREGGGKEREGRGVRALQKPARAFKELVGALQGLFQGPHPRTLQGQDAWPLAWVDLGFFCVCPAQVDRIRMAPGIAISLDQNYEMSGQVSWVGSSSLIIHMKLTREIDGVDVLVANFTFVARDIMSGKSCSSVCKKAGFETRWGPIPAPFRSFPTEARSTAWSRKQRSAGFSGILWAWGS